ncbi:unnamed protein product [Vitrella brassicaformis CCMP3155]|uniref:phosphatidylinositol 3-kinase n=3 Tax=Vitrella brassicaformis TaxID=1169539 RepID=A0A0G4ET88_VITBC|nr:unnamed protein product [Vitrella brassicaformis CCMP3155]|eukprot:CEM01653.1 unnamed protein product [Vitrella brassicaformis CCMP3155]
MASGATAAGVLPGQSFPHHTKDLLFHYSCDINVQFRIKVDRLYFSHRRHHMAAQHGHQQQQQHAYGFRVAAQLYCDKKPFGPPVITSTSILNASMSGGHLTTGEYGHFVSFPLKVRDLPFDSSVAFTVYRLDNQQPLGRAVLPLFSDKGVLRQSRQLVYLEPIGVATAINGTVPIPALVDPQRHSTELACQADTTGELAAVLRFDKLLDFYFRGHIPAVHPWVDQLGKKLLLDHVEAFHRSTNLDFLCVYLPNFATVVLFSEVRYGSSHKSALSPSVDGAACGANQEEFSQGTAHPLFPPDILSSHPHPHHRQPPQAAGGMPASPPSAALPSPLRNPKPPIAPSPPLTRTSTPNDHDKASSGATNEPATPGLPPLPPPQRSLPSTSEREEGAGNAGVSVGGGPDWFLRSWTFVNGAKGEAFPTGQPAESEERQKVVGGTAVKDQHVRSSADTPPMQPLPPPTDPTKGKSAKASQPSGAPVSSRDRSRQPRAIVSRAAERRLGGATPVVYFVDYDAHREAPASLKYHKLARGPWVSGQLGGKDARPSASEMRKLQELIQSPRRRFTAEEKSLLWQYRWTLVGQKHALTKFLHAVDWADPNERGHALQMLEKWERPALDDALELLSREFAMPALRQYAIGTLEKASESELRLYLLQLVQAIRYEDQNAEAPPLTTFLISRAVRSKTLSTYLHWYLLCEVDDPENGHLFLRAYLRFMDALLKMSPHEQTILTMLRRQSELRYKLLWATRVARQNRRIEKKIEKLRAALVATSPVMIPDADKAILRAMSPSENGLDLSQPPASIPLPVDPDVELLWVIPEESYVVRSSMYPVVLSCTVIHQEPACSDITNQQQQQQQGGGGGASATESHQHTAGAGGRHFGVVYGREVKKRYMFKYGDDLRQDQLVVQMIILMDSLLKKYGLDLKLTPYKVIATSPSDGMIEFVSGASALSAILSDYNNDIRQFFTRHHPDPSSPTGFKPQVLDNFIRSCAGYCVLTYLLGVGDRHLENILLDQEGHLFHIDFGFILGRDPKLFPPPMKLCREMVEAMGGTTSPGYRDFRAKCCQAYKLLRRDAKLILNLLSLMSDSGIKDFTHKPELSILKVQEKFRLDLNDESAESYFLTLINESVSALSPVVMEKLHKWALYWK